MAFPAGLTNGQTTTINGVAYVYSATDNAWTRVSTPFGDLAINGNLSANNATFTGNVNASGNVIAGNVYISTLIWANGTPVSFDGTYSNVSVEAYIGGNVGAYQIYANANIGTLYLGNISTQANLGAFQLYANANIGALQENITAFYTYANTKIGTNSDSNLVVSSTTESYSTTTGALVVKGGAGIAGNLWVSGNIYAANLISIASSTLSVQDPLLYLTADTLSPYNYDIGFYSQFIGGTLNNYQHTGLARDSGTSVWGLFSNVQSEPGTTINWADAGLIWETLKVGAVNIANATISTSSTTGALVVAGGVGIGGNIHVVGEVSTPEIRSAGGASHLYMTDIGLVSIAVASQEYKFGASGIESSPGIFGGTYGGNKLSLNNETALISNRYDTVTIQTGTDGSAQNTWTFGNATLTTPGNIVVNGNIDLTSGYISNVADPLAAQDAATKNYVDSQISGFSSTTISDGSAYVTAIDDGGFGNVDVSGNIAVTGNANIAGRVFGNRFYTSGGIYWSGNGAAYAAGGGGGGASALDDLTDVTISSPVTNQVLKYNGSFWVNGTAPGGGSSFTVTVDTAPPTLGNVIGDQWYDTTNDTLFEYINDGTTSYWIDVQSPTTFSAVPTTLQGAISINGIFSVTGSANIAGNLSTSSNMIVVGDMISGNVITGNITATGDITSTANVVSGNVVTGNITSSGDITSTGIIMSANVATSNVFVTGDITSTGIITSANIVTSNVYSTGDITADGTITSIGSITTIANVISGNVETGIITATGDITTAGNVTAGLTVTSANIVTANVLSSNITGANLTTVSIFASGTARTGNIITTSGVFWANGVSALSTYGNTDVNLYLPTYRGNLNTGNITANTSTGNLSILGGNLVVGTGTLYVSDGNVFITGSSGNLTVKGNIVQQGNYYETFSNITNTGGNLTCNFVNGSIFNVTSISANVTANFTNVNAISGAAIGATVIFNQGATAYYIANVQINGVNQIVRWVNGQGTGVAPTGLANNNDIISFSMLHLGSGNYKVFGQLSSY